MKALGGKKIANMQLACRHDERSGESYEVLDGKKRRKRVLKNVVCNLLTRDLVGE